MKRACRLVLFLGTALILPACSNSPAAGPAPPTFTLSSPSDAAIGVDDTPTFAWTPSDDATGYTLQVSTAASFSTFAVNQSGLTATSSAAASLAPGTMYFWRVFAQGPTGTLSAAGAPFSFTTVAPTPGDFTLTAPGDNSFGVSLTPTFTWTASLGAAGYRFQIASDTGFGVIVVDVSGLTATSFTPTLPLVPGTLYFWRVLAVSTNTVTATDAPFTFTTLTVSPPASFTLLNPASGAGGVSVLPTYSWTAASGAASYRLEVALDPAFTFPVIDLSGLTTTSVMPTTSLVPFTSYYWRVTATNAGGSTVASPAPLIFTTT
jgi:hypothetical protein